jgi:integrase
VLHSALDQAVAWSLLARNPAKLVDLPRKQRREIRALSKDELGKFLELACANRYSVLWHLLATTGIRPGEALALKWTDLDGDRIRIQRNLVRHADNRWTLKDPKTGRARRTVTVPATVVEQLKRHRTEQLEERLQAGPAYEDHGLVFSASNGSPLDWKIIVARHFRALAKDAGFLKLRPYDLRHTHATLLLQAGVNVKVVSERLGHASAALTLDVYSHVLPDMQQHAAERVEDLLFG